MEEEQLIRTIKCCLILNKHFDYNLDILYFHHSFDLLETSISFIVYDKYIYYYIDYASTMKPLE